jgi:hypothetical protein
MLDLLRRRLARRVEILPHDLPTSDKVELSFCAYLRTDSLRIACVYLPYSPGTIDVVPIPSA